jgi:hypothetical protein
MAFWVGLHVCSFSGSDGRFLELVVVLLSGRLGRSGVVLLHGGMGRCSVFDVPGWSLLALFVRVNVEVLWFSCALPCAEFLDAYSRYD